MKSMSIFMLASALGAVLASAPATAQYGGQTESTQNVQTQGQASQQQAGPRVRASRQAEAAIIALQTAVNANDVENIPARLAAAQAAARTPDDRYIVASLRLKAAVAAKNEAETAAALEALLATGRVGAGEAATMNLNLGKLYYAQQQHDRAAAALERVLASDPRNVEATIHLAEVRNSQGRAAEAVNLIRQAIAAVNASGQRADAAWYRRAVALAYNANLPVSVEISRDWLRAYPTVANWQESLRLFRNVTKPDDPLFLDVLRLQRAVGGLENPEEYFNYAFFTLSDRFPGEAKIVLDEGFASGKITRTERRFQDAYSEATAGAERSRAYLPEGARDALADPQARIAVRSGDAHFGFGDYAKAAEMYRAALGKQGADANLINLRLGAALALAGDRAGATAALNAVTGPRAELAKFWLIYLETRS